MANAVGFTENTFSRLLHAALYAMESVFVITALDPVILVKVKLACFGSNFNKYWCNSPAIKSWSCSSTKRIDNFAFAFEGITVLAPSPTYPPLISCISKLGRMLIDSSALKPFSVLMKLLVSIGKWELWFADSLIELWKTRNWNRVVVIF